MSKAFTRENDDSFEADDGEELPVPSGKNYMTRAGADALRDELRQILNVDRPEVVRVVSWAASNGDRSENGDYLYGKKKLREMDRRIRFLTKRIETAEVVDCEKNTTDTVLFGAWVRLQNTESEEMKVIRIVGADETNPRTGFISWQSPLAKAAIGQKTGDVFQVRTPKGDEEFEVLEVSYAVMAAERK
jgi:transcription elongation factor GreB